MELLPTSSKNNTPQPRRFRRASSIPLILTRILRFPQMDFEVKNNWKAKIYRDSYDFPWNISLHFGKWHIYWLHQEECKCIMQQICVRFVLTQPNDLDIEIFIIINVGD